MCLGVIWMFVHYPFDIRLFDVFEIMIRVVAVLQIEYHLQLMHVPRKVNPPKNQCFMGFCKTLI